MKTKNIVIISLVSIFLLSLVGVIIYFGFDSQAVVSFKNQCSLSPCPYGYTDEGTICQDLKCIRSCKKESGGHCGTFGREEAEGNYHLIDENTRTSSYWNSPFGPTESTSKCYKYRTATIFTITDRSPCSIWHSSKSHEVYTKDYTHKVQERMDYSSGNPVSSGSLWSEGKLGDGSENRASGRVIPYKGTVPKAGDNSCGSEGELSIYLFYKIAPWVKDYERKEMTCSYDCDYNSDCGTTQTGEIYCDGNNIVRDVTKNLCVNYRCESDTDTEIVEKCDYFCSGTTCLPKPEEPPVIIDKINVYRLQNNQCSFISILPSEKTSNDYNTLNECQAKITILPGEVMVYRFSDNKCSLIPILPSEKTDLDFDTKQGCEENIDDEIEKPNYLLYVSIGVIVIFLFVLVYFFARRKR